MGDIVLDPSQSRFRIDDSNPHLAARSITDSDAQKTKPGIWIELGSLFVRGDDLPGHLGENLPGSPNEARG